MDAGAIAQQLDEVQLVDVRLPNEWEAGHIEGARHVPEADLADRVGELDRSRRVVTVCRAGTRSEDAAAWLRGEGFEADSLDGGLLAWKWAGLPLTGPIVEPVPREAPTSDVQALHDELIEVALAIQAKFGADTEPTEEQLREFFRDRLLGEGKTPAEAEAFLAQMGED